MARIVLGAIVTDIRGSAGSQTFSSWKGIGYLRNKAVSVTNPQTIAQTTMRQWFATSVGLWDSLTDWQKALWEEYAQKTKVPNAKDEVVGDFGIIPEQGRVMSGFNAYVGINQKCKGAGFPRVSVPPLSPDPQPTAFVYVAGTGNILHIEYLATPNPEAKLRKVEVWLKGDWAGSHSYIAATAEVPEPPAIPTAIEIGTIRMGSGNTIVEVPFSVISPCWILTQLIIVRIDGSRSAPSDLRRVKITP